jgi:hypothetical protein
MDLAALLRGADRDSWRTLHADWDWGWTPTPPRRQSMPTKVPDHLVDFHAAVGRTIQNSLRPLDGLAADTDGFVTICDEAQYTFEWALREVELGYEDPPVWGRSSDPRDPWTVQSPTLSIFLVQTLIVDATTIGLSEIGFWGDGSPEGVQHMLVPMERLPWPSWGWVNDSGFYAGDDTVAWVTGEHTDWPLVHVAARTIAALEPFHIASPEPFRILGKGELVP